MIIDIFKSIATASIAFGIFPKQPKIVEKYASNKLLQWIFVFILILQGNSKFNVLTALITTLIVYCIVYILDIIFEEDCEEETVSMKQDDLINVRKIVKRVKGLISNYSP